MAVETTDVKTAQLACNGSVTTFPFSFPILATGDLKVYLITNATEAKELLTETTDYSVNATNDDYSSGGNVETVATYSSSYSILIVREVTNTQTTDYTVGDDLDADVLESDFDRRTMVAQEFADLLAARALVFPVQDPTTISGEMAPQADRLGKYLYFDATYGQPTMVDAISVGTATVTDFAKTVLDDEDADTFLATLGIPFSAFMKTLVDAAHETALLALVDTMKSITDDDYTVLDDDGFSTIRISPDSADKAGNLPTASANSGRKLRFENSGDGTYKVTVTPEGAEKVLVQSGNEEWELTSFELLQAEDWAEFKSDGTNWVKINAPYWHKFDDPATGWKASKTSGWTADQFTPGGLEITFSEVPSGGLAVRSVFRNATAQANTYYKKSGDSNVSNTPIATTEYSHLISNLLSNWHQVVMWLSSDLKVQIAVSDVNADTYFSYPIEYLQ